MCKETAEWVANSVAPDQMPHSAASDLGLHSLLRPVCPYRQVYQGSTMEPPWTVTSQQQPPPYCCVEVLRPSQPNGVISSAVSLPNHMFTGQA